jgi:hypothetical protein
MLIQNKSLLAIGVSLLLITIGRSSVLETSIKYISPQAVYLDAGTSQGVQKGDSAAVVRDNQVIAQMVIIYVAENSSSARIIRSNDDLNVGDQVRLIVSSAAISDSLGVKSLGQASPTLETYPVLLPTAVATESRLPTRLQGRIATQVIYQSDNNNTGNSVTKPSLMLRATVENLGVNYLDLSVNLKARRSIYQNSGSINHQSEWDNRFYELALKYENPDSPLIYQAGRISSNKISGIGYFDGGMITYEFSSKLSSGVFGGLRPNLVTSKMNPDETTGGIFVSCESGSWSRQRVVGTIALVGRYHLGTIDEEFVYEQLFYAWSRRFFVTQSAEISINRDWRRQAEGSSLGLSNVLLNASYTVTPSFSLDFGYDNRKLVHTYETKDTPDSLFDEALRQGFRSGISLKLPYQFNAWLRGGLQIRQTGERDTRTLTAGVNKSDIVQSGISGSLQYTTFENRYSTGYQSSLSLSRYLFNILYLQFETGQSKYTINQVLDPVNYHWFDLAASSNLTRHLYISSYLELYRGDLMDINRLSAELGYRF